MTAPAIPPIRTSAIPRSGEVPDRLFAAARGGDLEARRLLTERYLPLARSLAARFKSRGEPIDDLIQVAALGLMKALDRFEPARGLAFSSFAVPTILGELRRHFRDKTWSVRVPRQLQERSAQLTATRLEMSRELGRYPTVQELGAALALTEEEVLDAVQAAAAYRATSIDRPVQPGEDDPVSGLMGAGDGGFDDSDARMSLELLAATLLTARQRDVLWMHVDEDLTQDEIAKRIGVSQMQVSRDLGAARAVLREHLLD